MRSGAILLAAAALLPASRPSLDAPEALEAARVFSAYIAARGRQDLRTLVSLTDPAIRAVDSEGKPHSRDDDRRRHVLAWEGVMHARWTSRVLAWDGRRLEAEASEENDLYDALGVGASIIRHRIRVEHGRIVEWQSLDERSTGRAQPEALLEFKSWVGTLSPELREGVVEEGSLILTARSAEKMAPLLVRWKEEHPAPERARPEPGNDAREAASAADRR